MSNSLGREHEDEREFQPTHAHHPTAPSHESFDILTTIDPGYVISLIRRLLPSAVKDGEPATESGSIRDAVNLPENGGESSRNNCELDAPETRSDDQSQGESAVEKTWGECGCVLWDLAASEDHAQFMDAESFLKATYFFILNQLISAKLKRKMLVQNLILDVLLVNLVVSQSSRITEIALGIIGNLACHEISRKEIASKNGLVRVTVEQFLLDDVPCLSELCRVLTLCLQGLEGVIWAEALEAEDTLSRILWIAENALNPQLLEKIVGLLLAVLESQHEVATILIPPMLDLDLSSLLIKLLAFEMSKLKGERIPERYNVLDLVLRAIEALSTMDNYSQEICSSTELVKLVKELIELPDKLEVASSCVTAAVLIANILTDATNLASELSHDMKFLQGLFDVFLFASDDTDAQNAMWGVIARLLTLVKENEMCPPTFCFLVSILGSKLDLIEDELLARPLDHGEKKSARVVAMKRISEILTRWKFSDDRVTNPCSMEDAYIVNEDNVNKLLDLLL